MVMGAGFSLGLSRDRWRIFGFLNIYRRLIELALLIVDPDGMTSLYVALPTSPFRCDFPLPCCCNCSACAPNVPWADCAGPMFLLRFVPVGQMTACGLGRVCEDGAKAPRGVGLVKYDIWPSSSGVRQGVPYSILPLLTQKTIWN